jgi:hypothetical protein
MIPRPSCCSLLIMVVVVLGEGTVAARSPRERAAELMRAGNVLYNEGRFVEALEQYRRAQVHYPSHKLDFNIGVTLAALGKAIEAAEHLEHFITRDHDQTPQMIGVARRKLVVLQERLSRVGVICDRSEAAVFVDGRQVGQTPMRGWVYLQPGTHRISVVAPGQRPFAQTIVLYPGDHPRVTVTLAPEAPVLVHRADAPRRPPSQPPPTPIYKRWWLWTLVGVVVAGATVGTVMGVSAARNDRLPHGTLGSIP